MRMTAEIVAGAMTIHGSISSSENDCKRRSPGVSSPPFAVVDVDSVATLNGEVDAGALGSIPLEIIESD